MTTDGMGVVREEAWHSHNSTSVSYENEVSEHRALCIVEGLLWARRI